MTTDEAITLLKTIVKDSHLDNQKHLDLTLAPAEDRDQYQYALMLIRQEVARGNMTEEEVKYTLGLIL
jgi:hypothetical protein